MHSRLTQATDLLMELSRSVNSALGALQNAVSIVRPPALTASLAGVVQATENAALRVLDEAEALQDDQRKLSDRLERLRVHLPAGDPEALDTWQDAIACSSALRARAMKLIAAMEFQDLASHHIAHSVRAIHDVRERLAQVLAVFDIAPDETVNEAFDDLALLGAADQAHGSRQAVADQLFAEAHRAARQRARA
jgi:chemotaxis regulatin CheY-phosphate phosphatase CheZ